MRIDEELKTYLQALWRYKWMIIACTIIASLVALGISLKLTPLYSAEATLRVASAPGGSFDYTYIATLNQMKNTYVEMATSDIILNEVASQLEMQNRPNVQVEIVPNTELIKISTSDTDPTLARDIANTLANLLIEYSQQEYSGNLPTARGILEEQLQQAKIDLDEAVSEYNSILSISQSSDLERLMLVVQNRQDTYSNLLQRYEEALTNYQLRSNNPVTKEELEQARANLNVAMAEYNNALRRDRSSELESRERLINIRQQFYANLLQRYEEARANELLRSNAVSIINPASIPQDPSSPNVYLNTALGLFAGFAMGVILAFLFEAMDDTLRGVEDVQAVTTLPILCKIPELKRKLRSNVILGFSGNGHFLQAPGFDQLRAHLILSTAKPKSTDAAPKSATTKQKSSTAKSKSTTILVVSPEPSTGKSTMIANLAISLAEGGNRVVLIDMDYRRPRLHSVLGLSNEEGLSNFLRGEIQLDAALQTTPSPNLRVVTAGSNPDIPSEWLTPANIDKLLEKLGKKCDYVLIDSPAMLSVADSSVLASQADSVILIVARRKTRRKNLHFALQQLEELKVKILGIVVNRVPNSQMYKYYSARRWDQIPFWKEKYANRIAIGARNKQSDLDEE